MSFFVCGSSGLLIDFGLAEPAHKWKDRAEALVNHRDRRRSKAQGKGESRGTSRPTPKHKRRSGVSSSGRSARDLESPHQYLYNTSPGEISGKNPPGNREYSAGASIAGKSEGDDRLRLLRKAERGGTTGFRAPEILWHSRDQVSSRARFAVLCRKTYRWFTNTTVLRGPLMCVLETTKSIFRPFSAFLPPG